MQKKPIDPTAANRQAIGNFVTGLLPSGSPLKQSIEAEKAEAKAAELEARAQEERLKAAEQRAKEEAGMMSVGAPAQAAQPQQAEAIREPSAVTTAETVTPEPPSLLERGLAQEVAATDQLGRAQQAELTNVQAAIASEEEKAKIEREQVKQRIDAQLKEIEDTKIEPKSFWEGKSTGQRITAGIGLFLASLTEQGAANAQKIISNEIERDLDAQKANLGKKQNTLSQLQQKLGSIDAAESAYRIKALQTVELKLKANAEGAKGQFAKAKSLQGLATVQAERQKLQQELALKMAEKAEKNMGKMINIEGFSGIAPTEGEASKFRESIADAASAKRGLSDLINLSSKGSKLSLEDRARAETTAAMVRGALRTTLVGQGAVSDAERKILENIVANPLEVSRLSSVSKASLQTLMRKVDSSISEKAKSLGIQKLESPVEQFKRK